MSSVMPQLLLWDQSLNSSCGGRMQCESLFELGPPPDSILSIPPPPVPPFMEEFVSRLQAEGINMDATDEDSATECGLCHWADAGGVGFVELAQKGPLIDDTWFLVIISSCVGATLIGIILAIAFLKYREGKLKPLSDVALAKKEKALGLERCEAVLYPAPSLTPHDHRTGSRALWAGLKPLDGNHYTVDHCQPIDQKTPRIDLLVDSTYDYADYSSITYTPVGPTFGTNIQNHHNAMNMTMGHPMQAPIFENTMGHPMQAPIFENTMGHPIPMQAPSFENIAYVPGEDPLTVEKIGPDGCVVSRAAYLLGNKTLKQAPIPHLYEMVTPKQSSRRHKSLDRGRQAPPIISAPTSAPTMRLPPLNCRYNGRFTLTAMANGTHCLYPQNIDRKLAHVSIDRSGVTNTSIALPPDNIYSSPITSPVI